MVNTIFNIPTSRSQKKVVRNVYYITLTQDGSDKGRKFVEQFFMNELEFSF